MSTTIRQRDIKQLIHTGAARDITKDHQTQDAIGLNPNIETVAHSNGKYGCNGAVARDVTTDEIYACVGRCSAVYVLINRYASTKEA